MKTLFINGPKRSGTTLLMRLMDSCPGVVDFVDEAFFWEHAYGYMRDGALDVFVDAFRMFDSEQVRAGIYDRAILPWVDGVFKQNATVCNMETRYDFDAERFAAGLSRLAGCTSIAQVWEALVLAYSGASSKTHSPGDPAVFKTADYGRTILSGRACLDDTRSVFIMRNPYYAIDSLKKSRSMRETKRLHPINFAEAIGDYLFLWRNFEDICGQDTLLITYEHLLLNPEQTLSGIAAHFGIAYSDSLLLPSLRGQQWLGGSSFDKRRNIDPSALDRPLKVLDAHEIEYIGKHLGGLIEHFGYRLDVQAPDRRVL